MILSNVELEAAIVTGIVTTVVAVVDMACAAAAAAMVVSACCGDNDTGYNEGADRKPYTHL